MKTTELHDEELAHFNFPIEDKSEKIIKVIGVGGGEGNAVQHMWEEGVKNVTFMVANTDSQVLAANRVPNKIQLGDGLGTGGRPELGHEIAEKCIDEIKTMFDENTKMVFITAGMGGGTGTGVAPVIARVAKDMGILTVGVVTLPFLMEGKRRIDKAVKGLETLKRCVDSLIVINNEKLLESEQYNNLTWSEGMKKADEVLTIATKTIAEIITVRGIVNRDFNDVNTVMKDGGAAIVSVAKASGEKRILKAMSEAVNSTLIANVNKQKTKRLLYIIYSGSKNPAKIPELREINEFMEGFDEYIEVLWGHYPDETLDDEIKVSIVATGFDRGGGGEDGEDEGLLDVQKRAKMLRDKYYGTDTYTPQVLEPVVEEPAPTEEDGQPAADTAGDAESHEGNAEEDESEEGKPKPAPEVYHSSIFRKLIETLGQLLEE